MQHHNVESYRPAYARLLKANIPMTNTEDAPARAEAPPLQSLRAMRSVLGEATTFILYAKGEAERGGHAEFTAGIDACHTHIDSLVIKIDAAIGRAEELRKRS